MKLSLALLALAVAAQKTVTIYKCCSKASNGAFVTPPTQTVTYTNDQNVVCTTTIVSPPTTTDPPKKGEVYCQLDGVCTTKIIPPPGNPTTTVIICPKTGACTTTVEINPNSNGGGVVGPVETDTGEGPKPTGNTSGNPSGNPTGNPSGPTGNPSGPTGNPTDTGSGVVAPTDDSLSGLKPTGSATGGNSGTGSATDGNSGTGAATDGNSGTGAATDGNSGTGAATDGTSGTSTGSSASTAPTTTPSSTTAPTTTPSTTSAPTTTPPTTAPSTTPSSSSSTLSDSCVTTGLYDQIASSSGVNETFARLILDFHNEKRKDHHACPMSWSSEAFDYAKKMVDAKDCNDYSLTHSSNNPFGENLSMGWSPSNPLQGVQVWYDENTDYDYNNPKALHFTQMVWKLSLGLGCAAKNCAAEGNGWYIVCEYTPKGNIMSRAKENVLPK